MKRPLAIFALVALAVAGTALLWPADDKDAAVADRQPASPSPVAVQRVAAPRSDNPAPPPAEREPTPEQIEKRDRLAALDAAATEKRRALFVANIASVDAAIEKAEAEGGNTEYLEALRQRREHLAAQAAAEAEGEE